MLHIVKDIYKLELVKSVARTGDAILLTENAVYGVLQEISCWSESHIELYVLEEDLQARGLCISVAEEVATVDFPGFVGLTERHAKSVTWS